MANESPPSAPVSTALALSPWAGLGLALLAAHLAWFGVHLVHPVFRVPKDAEAPSIGLPPEVYLKNRLARERVERNHAMLYVGCFAALVALTLGVGEAALRRRAWPLLAVPVAALGGVLGGFAGSRVHEYTYEHVGQSEIAHTLLAQLAVLLPVGLGLGLGLGLSARSKIGGLKTALGGLAAGAVAAMAYPVLVSLVMPGASTDMLLPFTPASRGLWIGLAATCLGLIVPFAGRTRQQPPAISTSAAA